MHRIERAARRIDRAQQGFGPAAFAFGVVKKYGDDRGGSLAALITYYGFLSLFPLLLLLFTVLGIVVGRNQEVARTVEQSALAHFPVVGKDLATSISTLHANSTPGLVIGILGLLWGAQGAIQTGQFAMAQVWNVPGTVRPNFWVRLARTGLMMAVLGAFLLLGAGAAGFTSFVRGWPVMAHVGGVALTLVLNVLLYVVAFRILTPRQVAHRDLLLGAVLGGVGWTVLQYAGTLVVDHLLRNTSQIYGFFAIVLGLLAWIYLGAELTLYAAELNVVRARRLWPRGMVQPPLTTADRRVLAAISLQAERRPEQRVQVTFRPDEPEEPREAGPPGGTAGVGEAANAGGAAAGGAAAGSAAGVGDAANAGGAAAGDTAAGAARSAGTGGVDRSGPGASDGAGTG